MKTYVVGTHSESPQQGVPLFLMDTPNISFHGETSVYSSLEICYENMKEWHNLKNL